MSQLNSSKSTKNSIDFSICLDCASCHSNCIFVNDKTIIKINRQQKHFAATKLNVPQTICSGECGKKCITQLRFTKTLIKQDI